jgi:hypothetical protein
MRLLTMNAIRGVGMDRTTRIKQGAKTSVVRSTRIPSEPKRLKLLRSRRAHAPNRNNLELVLRGHR